MLSLQKLKDMRPGEIFATGTSTYPELIDAEIKWVAVRGGIHDWAIYYGFANMSEEKIASRGDKIFTESVIKRLVPCDEEAWNMYRY